MAKADIIVGLEIGTSKVCAVVCEMRHDGNVKILGVGQTPSRGVRKGEIVDFDTAGKCVREALVDAEDKSGVVIERVYLAIGGGHIQSFNNRGAVNIPEDREEICEEDLGDVETAAREVSIPAANTFVDSVLQRLYVDGKDGVLDPLGMIGSKLEADFHIIHGVANRIKNSVRCVRELDIEVDGVVFTPLASAQVVLDLNQKTLGALVIDMGGGTTGYVVYVDGSIRQSGCLAIGGDHITNDLSLGLRIPMAKAEKLKKDEGSVIVGESMPGETVVLRDETGFAGKEIEREMLNTIIHCRVRETFELIKREIDSTNCPEYLAAGVLLTGGCSQINGVGRLAEEVFGMPVHVTHAQTVSGVTSAFENPQFSTAIGLVKYAQTMRPPKPRGFFDRLRMRLPFIGLAVLVPLALSAFAMFLRHH